MKMSLKARYWYSYIIIFLLPVVCLGVFIFIITQKNLKEDALTKNTITLQKISNLVDSQLEQVYRIPLDITINDSFRNFTMKKDPHGALSVMRYLKNSMLMNTFVEDVYLYFYGDDYLVSSGTTVTVPGFFSVLYQYNNWTQEEFETALNTSTALIRGEETVGYLNLQTQNQMTFLMPVGYINGSPYANALIILKGDKIIEMINNSGIHSASDFMIINSDTDSVVFSSKSTELTADDEFLKIINSFEKSSKSTAAESGAIYVNNGIKYHIAHKYSDSTFLRYVSVTPVSELTTSLNQLTVFFVVGLALLTGVILLLILFFLNRNYNPIRNLKQFSQQLITQNEAENLFLQDEIEQIRKCLEYLNSNNITLKKEVVDGKSNLKSCVVFDLIRGEFPNQSRFEGATARAGMHFLYKLFAVSVIHSKAYGHDGANKIIADIEGNRDVPYTTYAHRHFESDKIILIINLEQEHKNRLYFDLKNLNDYLEKKYSIHQTVGFSQCYNDIADIPKAFFEASTAANHRLLRGGSCVISYGECLPKDDADNVLHPLEIQQFGKLIKNGDYNATKKFLDDLKQRLKNTQFPIYVVKSICFDVVCELKRAAANIFTLPPSYCDALDLLEYDTTDELFDTIDIICRPICDAVLDMTSERESSKIDSMILYIENNCKNPDFSTDRMAEDFSQSSPALCQYFKQKTGKTVTDYLVDFRMSRAKELLVSTNYPLTQIAYEVGYYNVSSFIRRFKQMVGCSPGVYRETPEIISHTTK